MSYRESRDRDYSRDNYRRGGDSRSERSERSEPRVEFDVPPNSRLFILCPKGITEADFRSAFEEYGTIEDIWIIKDKRTHEDRGIVYIKFAKTSEAMQAMEEMNGKAMPGHQRRLKVVVANSKRDGSTRDSREDEKLVRLFVIIPKSYTEANLRDEFGKYGDVDSVTVLKNRDTGENKGFGYVKFHKPTHAAIAFENCDSSYKPKFADPLPSKDYRVDVDLGFSGPGHKRLYDDDFGYRGGHRGMDRHEHRGRDYNQGPGSLMFGSPSPGPREFINDYPTNSGCSRLIIQAPVGFSQGYLAKLFDLIPGMEYCDLNEATGIAYARYSSPQCAAYARDKLMGFEYPLGSPLHVTLAEDPGSGRQEFPMSVDTGYGSPYEREGLLGSVGDGRKERPMYCSVPLPPPQPTVLDEQGKNLAQRLFIVCQTGVADRVLKDAFCRFGNLIDVFLLSGRNYGYAKYASKDSAQRAMDTLHGQTIAGQRIKVLEAEPPKSYSERGSGDEGPTGKKQRL